MLPERGAKREASGVALDSVGSTLYKGKTEIVWLSAVREPRNDAEVGVICRPVAPTTEEQFTRTSSPSAGGIGRDILKYPGDKTSLTTKVWAAVAFVKANDIGDIIGG
jgi:hypothetical protein